MRSTLEVYVSDYGTYIIKQCNFGYATWAEMIGRMKWFYETGWPVLPIRITPKLYKVLTAPRSGARRATSQRAKSY